MTRTRIVTLALVAVAMVAALALVVGCGSSSSKTLESYFKANQSEWNSAVAQIKESGGDTLDVDMSVTGNKISQIMTYKQTFSDEAVATIKSNIEAQADTLKSTIKSQIKAMEKEVGISGITWFFDYRNGDGKSIYSMEVDGK
ncbi:MAG: DUF4854 domain-containing protein [Eggerthellaceae bacterium]|nr:DUF4854 domain-containing protein [Eggerthellaceae bacterium]